MCGECQRLGLILRTPRVHRKQVSPFQKDKDKNKNKEGNIVPPTSVTADPAQAKVAAKGGKWTQQINNRGDKKLIFKIRCSNNNAYRVSPVFGFIDASGNTNIEVIRLSGAPKEDKLVVQYAVAPADATDAQTAFAQLQPTGNLVVNVVAA
ncbi:MSP domain protein [Teladorsagia circumcincta]|uniref:Major sperm protein n=1 Tax=Teladorsagia circumcincta TaxID=45464 RepID=A0A2G9UV50_TELCI|nr:MSP domain protein [Teladorsagia circumcincta]